MKQTLQLSPSWFLDIRLKFRHLQLLQALSRHNTLQDAADSLGLAQPAASRLLGDLEEMIGTPLFRRDGRRLVLNSYGELLTRRSKNLLEELERTREEFNTVSKGGVGSVSIGAIDGPVVDLLTQAVLNIQSDNPGIELEIRTGSSIALSNDLMNGEIDIMIGRPPEEENGGTFHYLPIGEEPMVISTRPGNPLLLKGRTIRLEEMASYPGFCSAKAGNHARNSRMRLLSAALHCQKILLAVIRW
ncbi:LysR family transcriptional regulator [Asaia prunellae]|uniref:LysR family transcriptional regulator n=1 Tax=Asaia prunellae TaxID=610245 RepID=UPI0004715D47|nr:LysR substrate-binding domain-containing protein [Asaia prunellae]